MELVDWAARWDPLPRERPLEVWLPEQHAAADPPSAAATRQAPQSLVVTLTPHEAAELPLVLPRLLARQDVRPGDRVTVDLADHGSVHLSGLELLLAALWRRVGPHGEVLLTGGTPGLRAQLESLEITPASCRAAVHGPLPAPAAVPGAVPPGASRPAPLPQQRRPRKPLPEPDRASDVPVA